MLGTLRRALDPKFGGIIYAAKADSSLEHAAVGRKLDFGYYECPPGQTLELDRRVCSFCSNEEPGEGEGCTEAASDL